MSANGIPELPTAPGRTGSSFKLLAFGGASRGAVLLVLMAVAGFLLLSCGESGPPSPGSTLHLVPANAEGFAVFNIAEMKASPDVAEAMEIDLSEEFVVGLIWEDFDELTTVAWEGNDVSVLKGSFDFDDVRDELEELGLEESSYRGYELWERFALLQEDGYLIFSSSPEPIEEVLKNLYRGEGHLAGAEDNDLKRILEKLPEAFLKGASVREGFCPVKRCQGAGISFTGMDLDREAVTGEIAILFSSERSAEDAAEEYDAIADFVKEEWGSDLENAESDGEFVIGTATEKIEDDDLAASETGADSPSPLAGIADKPAIASPETELPTSLLSLLLVESEFVLMEDVQVLQSEAYIGSSLVEDLGLDKFIEGPFQDADVSVMGVSENPFRMIMIFKGNPEFVYGVREDRSDDLQEGGLYQGYEVYHDPSDDKALALLEEAGYAFAVFGDDSRTRLEELLDNYPSWGKDSLANPMDNDLRRILDEIGDAPVILLSTDIAEFDADLAVDVDGFRALGTAMSEEDGKSSTVTAFLFTSEAAAETALANSDFISDLIDELHGDESESLIYGPNRKGKLIVMASKEQ